MTKARELLRASEAGGARSNNSNSPASAAGDLLWFDPALAPCTVRDRSFDRLDRDRRIVDVERARRFAGCWTDTAGDLREVVGLMQPVDRAAPVVAIDKVVPVRNEVVHRASRVTERDAAIHAARGLACDR